MKSIVVSKEEKIFNQCSFLSRLLSKLKYFKLTHFVRRRCFKLGRRATSGLILQIKGSNKSLVPLQHFLKLKTPETL